MSAGALINVLDFKEGGSFKREGRGGGGGGGRVHKTISTFNFDISLMEQKQRNLY